MGGLRPPFFLNLRRTRSFRFFFHIGDSRIQPRLPGSLFTGLIRHWLLPRRVGAHRFGAWFPLRPQFTPIFPPREHFPRKSSSTSPPTTMSRWKTSASSCRSNSPGLRTIISTCSFPPRLRRNSRTRPDIRCSSNQALCPPTSSPR